MVPSAEWVQSVYSCRFEVNGKTFIAPNRDYPYEGLLVHQDGENWKFIDCIGVGMQTSDGRYASFDAESNVGVRASPWKVTYDYKALCDFPDGGKAELPFSVSYILHSCSTPAAVTGCIELTFQDGQGLPRPDLAVIVQPFLDLRHMFAAADHGNYQVWSDDNRITTASYNRRLTFYIQDGEINHFEGFESLSWFYKLGAGNRKESFSHEQRAMATVFIAEHKNVAAFFSFRFESPGTKQIFFSCCLDNSQQVLSEAEVHQIATQSEEADRKKLQEVERSFSTVNEEYRHAVWARIIGLTKFKSYVPSRHSGESIPVPHAGAWWFRTAWFRDMFEGILSSFRTLMLLPDEKANLKEIILLALSGRDRSTGLVVNRIPEFKSGRASYDGCDATLLCFITAHKYVLETKDLDLAWTVVRAAMETISCFLHGWLSASSPEVDGPPKVDLPTGLLRCAPHHSWLDTRAQCVQYAGYKMDRLPSRISAKFVKDIYDHSISKEDVGALLSSPSFFLPEINAQWIEMLRGAVDVLKFFLTAQHPPDSLIQEARQFEQIISPLLARAKQSFIPVFWNDEAGFLYNAVCDNKCAAHVMDKTRTVCDEIECEAAITAAAMLGKEVFEDQHLEKIWARAQKVLLVYRWPVKYGKEKLPFGVMAKNNDDRIYYDDSQYHNDVIWPRSTPYLAKLLSILGRKDLVKGLLVNALDHQMTEGVVFYSHELLSRPFGNNLWPNKGTQYNPVPVKNPIQFWSQWCDLLVDFFASEGVVR